MALGTESGAKHLTFMWESGTHRLNSWGLKSSCQLCESAETRDGFYGTVYVVLGSAAEESSQGDQNCISTNRGPGKTKGKGTEQGEDREQTAVKKTVNPVVGSNPHCPLVSQGRATWTQHLERAPTPNSGLTQAWKREVEARLGVGMVGWVPGMAYLCSGQAFQWRPVAEVDWRPSLHRHLCLSS